jgi:hypothetical protein
MIFRVSLEKPISESQVFHELNDNLLIKAGENGFLVGLDFSRNDPLVQSLSESELTEEEIANVAKQGTEIGTQTSKQGFITPSSLVTYSLLNLPTSNNSDTFSNSLTENFGLTQIKPDQATVRVPGAENFSGLKPRPPATSSPLTFTIANYDGGNGPKSIHAADFNKDGWLDLVVCDRFSNQVAILLNQKNGTFTAPSFVNLSGSTPLSLDVGDINGDKAPDMVTADSASSTVSILLNNGSGSFTLGSPLYVLGSVPHGVTVADLNGDGKNDIALTNSNANAITVLSNDGTGKFPQATNHAVGSGPWDVIAFDLNSDGALDLVAANSISNDLTVLLNNGKGSFTASGSFPVGIFPYGIYAGDFNKDGKLDLVAANSESNTVSVLMNQGNGKFASAVNYAVNGTPKEVAVGDFNGDQNLDIAVATVFGTADILLGDGKGTFSPKNSIPVKTGTNLNGITVGDFNKDGKLDIAVSNGTSNLISVLLNTTPQAAASTQATASNQQALFPSDNASIVATLTGQSDFTSSVAPTLL